MTGYWLPFASCLIGIIGALIALKYGRITTETHRNYLSVAFIAVLVALGISYDWPSSQTRTFTDLRDKYDGIGLRLTDLRKRVNANNAATQGVKIEDASAEPAPATDSDAGSEGDEK